MRIPLADDIIVSGSLVYDVTDRITCRDLELPQEQHRGRRKIFTVTAARLGQETGQRGFICVRGARTSLPGAVGKLCLEEPPNSTQDFLGALACQSQFFDDCVQSLR